MAYGYVRSSKDSVKKGDFARKRKKAAYETWKTLILGDVVTIKRQVRTQSNKTVEKRISGKIVFLSLDQAIVEEKPWRRHCVLFNDLVNPDFKMVKGVIV